MAKKKATNERIEVSSMMKKANKEKTEAVSMVKKVSKEIKAKIEAGTKIKCPVCECVAFAKITKKDSLSIWPCPSCNETIEAQECCIVCDFGQNEPSPA